MEKIQNSLQRWLQAFIICLLTASLVSGCEPNVISGQSLPAVESVKGVEVQQETLPAQPTLTEYVEAESKTETIPQAPEPAQSPLIWISPALPQGLAERLQLPESLPVTSERDAANIYIEIPGIKQWLDRTRDSGGEPAHSFWVYALAAPFPTIRDEISLKELQSAWAGRTLKEAGGKPLLMSSETRTVLESWWGPARNTGIQTATAEDLLDAAWESGAWAIIPFEEIQPRWKILRVEGQSVLDRGFDPASYPLAVPVWIDGAVELPALPTNRDPDQLTVLAMTGVTALSRHIGERMESKGLTYPARDIGSLLKSADLTHISNEVAFNPNCPTPGPGRLDMRFCSHPKYIELLEAVGTDIVELTGNHSLDWGHQPFLDTLEMYRQRGWGFYGGGANLEQARQPLLVEHNGNQLAFLGCSPSGPENVWADADEPGSAPCDFALLETQIHELRAMGYLPVVTLQAIETDTYLPAVAQGMPLFRRLARAGAVVVSGSQSHVPQTMTFVDSDGALGSSFVHYGLGNLFFDQMKPLAARQQFIDRHVFYDGKYLGVELITTLLEDYARPRPMTTGERSAFLEKIFDLSDWSGPQP